MVQVCKLQCMHADMHTNSTCMEFPLRMHGALIKFQKRDGHTYTYIQLPVPGPQSTTKCLTLMHSAVNSRMLHTNLDPVFNGSDHEDSLPQET